MPLFPSLIASRFLLFLIIIIIILVLVFLHYAKHMVRGWGQETEERKFKRTLISAFSFSSRLTNSTPFEAD
jgi:hypothetical protein